MTKNAFFSLENLFSFSRYLRFRLGFLVMQKASLVKKETQFQKFTSQPGSQTVAMHILINISRSKSNQTIKYGKLIEYNMRNNFLEKSYTKCGGETILSPFSKKSKFSISVNQWSKVLCNLFFFVCPVEDYRNILKISCNPLPYTSYKTFLKTK